KKPQKKAASPKAVVGQGTVYNVEVSAKNVLDLRKPSHREAYKQAREEYNKRQNDPDKRLPPLTSEGFINSKSGLPSFGFAKGLLDALPGYDGVQVAEGGGE